MFQFYRCEFHVCSQVIMQYRKEIDGLRALAVIPVVFFHAGIDVFSGGFVGVDIFFVISGYLITGIILSDLQKNQFSLMNFYQRRGRRILPALFFVMAVSTVIAWWVLPPSSMEQFSGSLFAASTFWSNVFFWKTGDYFAPAAELQPLLHTWSLSVEEQYYLLFPLLLIVLWRFGRNHILLIFSVLLILSIVLAQSAIGRFPEAVFYFLPTRGWELLMGAIVAILIDSKKGDMFSKTFSNLSSGVGLVLIIVSIFVYDDSTPFPGVYALLPTVGAVLILMGATEGTLVQRILSMPLMVSIGLISYSAYLWHQPIFAFTRQEMPGELSGPTMIALCVILVPIAYLSWRYIEQPFRRKSNVGGKYLLLSAFSFTIVFVYLGILGGDTNGFEGRSSVPESVKQSFARSDRENECFYQKKLHLRKDWLCNVGFAEAEPTFLVFGDSHALSLLDSFDFAGNKTERKGVFAGTPGCVPFLNIYALRVYRYETDCYSLNRRVLELVDNSPNIRLVILVARWSYYTDGNYYGNDWSHLSLIKNGNLTKKASREAFEFGLRATADALAQRGVTLKIITQIPHQIHSPKAAYFQIHQRTTNSEEVPVRLRALSVNREKHEKLQKYSNELFQRHVEDYAFEVITLDGHFCDERKCLIGNDEFSYYYDDNHLSVQGAMQANDSIVRSLM